MPTLRLPPPALRPGLLVAVLVALLAAPLAAVLAVPAPPATASAGASGTWPLQPAPPPVVRRFDPPESPYGPGHRGVDLLGHPGQAVHAALAGTVTWAGLLAGVGVVVVDDGATRTTYQPVTATVPVGTPLTEGAVVGRLGPAGSHCFPRACLHWGWIRDADDVYLDPLLLVGAGPVRLLPLWRDQPVGSQASGGLLRLPRPLPRPFPPWVSGYVA